MAKIMVLYKLRASPWGIIIRTFRAQVTPKFKEDTTKWLIIQKYFFDYAIVKYRLEE